MENKNSDIELFLLMAVGAIIGGIGGAATVSELPENWNKMRKAFGKKKDGSDSDESE